MQTEYGKTDPAMARLAAHAASEKKAREIRVLDIQGISSVADYFVICTGTSQTHVRAIADSVEKAVAEQGLAIHHMEGYQNGRWILLDFGDLVVHVMQEEERAFYNLERLWGDAKEVQFETSFAG